MPRPVSARGACDTQRLDDLATTFERYRRSHPGQRFPRELRARVVAALDAGVSATAVGRECRLSWEQVRRWRAEALRLSTVGAVVPPPPPARVLSVVDTALGAPTHGEAELELRVGPWHVRLSRAVG